MALIILNGVSSAGKSSIAKCLQSKLDGKFLHFQMDTFWNMLPSGTSAAEFPNLKYAMVDAVGSLLKQGHNVIFDIVCPPAFLKSGVLEKLQDYQPYLVLVKASPETLREREALRSDRNPGLAESQILSIYKDAPCDLEIDNSSLTAEQSAEKIAQAYSRHNMPRPSLPMPAKRKIAFSNGLR